jgi:hypothetical protein
MTTKIFKLDKSQIVDKGIRIGACLATDYITVDGHKVDYMYREEPDFEADSGWRFQAGLETQEYIDNPNNLMYYDVNTIANYDEAIIPYLALPIGSELVRVKGTKNFSKILQ